MNKKNNQQISVDLNTLKTFISDSIEVSVKRTFNGNLDKLRFEIKEDINELREEQKIFMKELTPYLSGLRAVKLSGKAISWSAIFIVTVGSAILVIRKLFTSIL